MDEKFLVNNSGFDTNKQTYACTHKIKRVSCRNDRETKISGWPMRGRRNKKKIREQEEGGIIWWIQWKKRLFHAVGTSGIGQRRRIFVCTLCTRRKEKHSRLKWNFFALSLFRCCVSSKLFPFFVCFSRNSRLEIRTRIKQRMKKREKKLCSILIRWKKKE